MYHIETSSGGKKFPKGYGIVVNTKTGQHFSMKPIPISKAEAQLRLLHMIEARKR
jgi:cell fate regulator YaaT (PSP1 superfamily)